MIPSLKIRLFGKFTIEREGKPVKGLEANKDQELLSFLLVHRYRCHPRETLASLLWGETSTQKSKKYLRQALWHLQSALEEGVGTGGRLLEVDHDWVQLNVQHGTWLDLETFERAYTATKDTPERELDREQAELLEEAVELYRSDLLEGWYQDWCLFERERLQNMYLSMLDRLITFSERHCEYEAGLNYGSAILRYDRARERTYHQLMMLQYLSGDRTGALRQYARCVAVLRDELGVRPGSRINALYERIRDDEPIPAASSAESTESRTAFRPVGSLPEIADRLRGLQSMLTSVQQRVQHTVKAIEQGLETLRHPE